MTLIEEPKDLVVLVADGDMKATVEVLLSRRYESIGMRKISSEVIEDDDHDPGVFRRCHELLRSQRRQFRHAIAICDREGSGKESVSRTELEKRMKERLAANGWNDSAEAIVIDPELEIWAWANSAEVARVLGWPDQPGLHAWLQESDFLRAGQAKPVKPKEAWKQALRLRKKPRSSALFQALAGTITLDGCVDPAFGKLKTTLQRWFPLQTVTE